MEPSCPGVGFDSFSSKGFVSFLAGAGDEGLLTAGDCPEPVTTKTFKLQLP